MCAFSFAEIILVSPTVRDSPAKRFPNEDKILFNMFLFPNLAVGMQGLSKFEAGFTRRLPANMWRVGRRAARSSLCM
jgi:hypothetical protein